MATVVFDLDGTLADTSGDLLAAANTVFRAWGYGDLLSLDRIEDCSAAVKGSKSMLRHGLVKLHGLADEAQVDAGYQPLLDAYEAAIAHHTVLYPGALAAVERLRRAGHKVAICTNKPGYLAETLLAELGIRDLFAAMIAADTLPVRKPDPAPLFAAIARAGGTVDGSVLIGDTVTDRTCAKNAGVPSVLVTFGPDGQAVAELEPEALLHHYDELEPCLGALGLI